MKQNNGDEFKALTVAEAIALLKERGWVEQPDGRLKRLDPIPPKPIPNGEDR